VHEFIFTHRIARITEAISVDVRLIRVRDRWTVVAGIALLVSTIGIRVHLVGIVDERAVVGAVENAIVISIRIACIAQAIAIGVLLTRIWNTRAVVGSAACIRATEIVIWPSIEILVNGTEKTIACPSNAALASAILEKVMQISTAVTHSHQFT
jgi:hypothetical protein